MWNRDAFIAITKDFAQLLDVDKQTITKETKDVARIRIRIRCASEDKIPEKRMVIVGDRRWEIFVITS